MAHSTFSQKLGRLDSLAEELIAKLTKFREEIVRIRDKGSFSPNALVDLLSVISTVTMSFYDLAHEVIQDIKQKISAKESPEQSSAAQAPGVVVETVSPQQIAERISKLRKRILEVLSDSNVSTSAQIGKKVIRDKELNPDGMPEVSMIYLCEDCLNYLGNNGLVKRQGAGWAITPKGRESF